MAQAPSDQELEQTLQQSEIEENAKREAQKKEGKDFVNSGQGVMPEEVWQKLPGKKADPNG